MPVPIWVHLTYQSAFVDEAGKLQTRRDVYNIDSRTIAAIKSERGMIEPLQERKRDQEVASSGQRRVAAPPPPRIISFFEALFGGRPAQAQAGAAARRHALIEASDAARKRAALTRPRKDYLRLWLTAASFRHSRLSRFMHRGGRVR